MCIENIRPFTLRKLKWMADAKREHEYDIAIQLTLNIGQLFSNKFNPMNANPIRCIDVLENQTDGKEGFALLGAGLKMLVR